jgi:hypothetical protein
VRLVIDSSKENAANPLAASLVEDTCFDAEDGGSMLLENFGLTSQKRDSSSTAVLL